MDRGERGRHGGILGLAETIADHGRALEYDLLTRTGLTLDDVGGRLSWAALRSFVEYLPADSALVSETCGEVAPWLNGQMVAPLLATLIDAVQMQSWAFALANTRRGHGRPPRPKPFPTPWNADRGGECTFGRDALPVDEFEAWWAEQVRRIEEKDDTKAD